ncbi:type II secretion system protein F [Vibrio neptunius]|uniref:type II secretion system F family protein n=1 Tax=Vibrio neptunius TaxID=170651 RepID=UPI0005FA89A4|nr:type II secretion system F family protein [Vibrio neptunius]KJY84705.1 type II secretion system protein F [Vibrio neptunius]
MSKESPRTFSKLESYYWQGVNQKGWRLKGTILAVSDIQVMEQLNERNIDVRFIRRKPLACDWRFKHSISSKDLTHITRQWATMLTAGLPITTSLKIIMQNQKRPEIRATLWMTRHQLQAGHSVTDALRQSSRCFDSLYLDLINVGEKTGGLAASLERIAEHRERTEQLTHRIQCAAIYPSLVLFTALAVTVLMLTKVIPEFEALFSGYQSELPWFTQQVLWLSHTVQRYSLSIVAFTILIPIAITFLYRGSAQFQHGVSRAKLRLPVIGSLFIKSCLARFSHTLSTCIASGLPILISLETAARTTRNTHYKKAIEHIVQQASSGVSLHSAMRQSGHFPELMVQMIMIGEESGQLDKMLERVVTQLEDEINTTIESLEKILEPILILVLGGLVGSLVIAMYLPIFNLMNIMG